VTAPGAKTCARCGASFGCDRQAGKPRCWCEDLPPAGLPADPAADCLCPSCLKKECEKPR
jgi:hypothetical protein